MNDRGAQRARAFVVGRQAPSTLGRSARRIAELPRALAALDTALEAMQVAAFVLDLDGEVLHANQAAHLLLERDADVPAWLAQVAADGRVAPTWDIIPLRGVHASPGFLAILRSPVNAVDAVEDAARRWRMTPRQGQVLDLVVRGLTNATIGETLGIGKSTVEFHLSAIFDKAGVDNRAMLIARLLDR